MLVGSYVLAVDDDPSALRLLKLQLSDRGFQVTTATCSEEALRIADERPPLVALLDVRMPGMNGIQLLRKLRERWRMPVIMLTAAPSRADERTAMELGAEAYLVKPVHPDDLTHIIGEALRQA